MDPVVLVVVFALGGAAGLAAGAARWRRPADVVPAPALERLRDDLDRQRADLERHREASIQAAIRTVTMLAREQLGTHTDASTAALDHRNALMDERLDALHRDLGRVTSLVSELERDRQRRFGQLDQHLDSAGRATADLIATTRSLQQALSGPATRGRWGERMAQDVLRTAGFVEGVHYRRQVTTRDGARPDVTFLLPDDRCVHMDVKFPLDNYLRAVEADDPTTEARFRGAFLKDVRARVRELSGRGYIDPAAGTLDHLLLFLPNEHVYGYVLQHDPELVDLALEQRVVLCSPLSLFAVLSVVREAADNFALDRASGELLERLAAFGRQWDRFVEHLDRLGKRLDATRKDYDALVTTRRRGLERELDRIDDLRQARGETHPDLSIVAGS